MDMDQNLNNTPVRNSIRHMRHSMIPSTPGGGIGPLTPRGTLGPRNVNTMDKENYVTKSDYQGLKVKMNRVAQVLEDCKSELEETRGRLRKKEDDCVKLFKEKRNLEVIKGAKSGALARSREVRTESAKRMDVLSQKVATLQNKLVKKEGDSRELIQHLTQASEEMQAEMQQLSADLEKEINEREILQSKTDNAEAQLQSAKDEVIEITNKHVQDLADGQAELEEKSERASALVSEIEAALQRETEQREAHEKLDASFIDQTQELERISLKRNDLLTEITNIKKGNMALTEEKASVETELKQAKQSMVLQLEAANESGARHKKNCESMLESNSQMQGRVTDLEEKVTQLQKECHSKAMTLTVQSDELAKAEEIFNEKEELLELNYNLSEELERYESEFDRFTNRITELTQEVAAKTESQEKTSIKLTESQELIQNLQKQNQLLLESVHHKDTAIESVTHQFNEITSERDSILKDKNDQAMQFQESALQVNKVLQERESAIQTLKGKLEPLQRESTRLRGEIEEGKKCMFL